MYTTASRQHKLAADYSIPCTSTSTLAMLTTATKSIPLAAALLLTSCHAQGMNDTSTRSCQGPTIGSIASGNRYFNSTGTARLVAGSIQDDDWYVSVAITDRRDPHVIFEPEMPMQQRYAFIRVPDSLLGSQEGNETEYCVYALPSQDASQQKEAGDCRGVLSDNCIDTLILNMSVMLNDVCPTPENIEDVCGFVASQPAGRAQNFSSTECSLTDFPHVDLPDNYRTAGTYYTAYAPVSESGGGYENFDIYDKNVREALPMVYTINRGGVIRHEVVCVAPNNVVEGSRVPKSAAAQLSSGTSVAAALAVMGLVSVLSIA